MRPSRRFHPELGDPNGRYRALLGAGLARAAAASGSSPSSRSATAEPRRGSWTSARSRVGRHRGLHGRRGEFLDRSANDPLRGEARFGRRRAACRASPRRHRSRRCGEDQGRGRGGADERRCSKRRRTSTSHWSLAPAPRSPAAQSMRGGSPPPRRLWAEVRAVPRGRRGTRAGRAIREARDVPRRGRRAPPRDSRCGAPCSPNWPMPQSWTSPRGRSSTELNVLDQARVLEARLGGRAGLAKRIATDLRLGRPALSHYLLAALPGQEAATTNYDRLFEIAADGAGSPVSVLPWESAGGKGGRWLLKLHGIDRPPGRHRAHAR